MKKYKKLQNFAKCLLPVFFSAVVLFGCAENFDDEPLPTEIIISEPEELPVETVLDEVDDIPAGEPSASEETIVEIEEVPEEIVLPKEPPKSETLAAPVISKEAETSETEEAMVWIPTKGGKKYHRMAECSNMSEPANVALGEAEKKGFTACKRCY